LVVIMLSLFVVANAGGRIITLVNTVWRFILAGGVQAMSGGGDLGTLRARMAEIPPLIPSEAVGTFLILLMVIALLVGIFAGRNRRFRRPPSAMGLLIGLINGYLVGAYLLVNMLPSLAGLAPLPFGLSQKLAGGAAPPPAGPGVTDIGRQLVQGIERADPVTLALSVMLVIAAIVLIALVANLRGRGGGRRNNREGARD
jgi:hypothetical protein